MAGYGSPDFQNPQKVPRLWKSTDKGTTWERVNVGDQKDGALGNSDVSLAVAPDGTLYFATMQFDLTTFKGVHVVVGVSKDAGQTWEWKMLSKHDGDDRPRVGVAPDGTVHVTWNDGNGVYHRATHDRGASWSEPQMIEANAGSSFLAVGPKGEITVRLVPISASGKKFTEGIDFISVSTDGGSTWQRHAAPGNRDWAPLDTPGATPRWVEPLAWDSRGHLYSLWTNIKGIWLAESEDRGVSWKTYKVADIYAPSYYPDLATGSSGELAATWFSGAGESLRWHACLIQFREGAEQPHFIFTGPLPIDSWGQPDGLNFFVRSTAGEYLQPIFLKDGSLAVATPIQNPKNKRQGFTFWRFKPK